MTGRHKRFRKQAIFILKSADKGAIFPFTADHDNDMVNDSRFLIEHNDYFKDYFTDEIISLIEKYQWRSDRLVITITPDLFRFDVYHFDCFKEMGYKHISSTACELFEYEAINFVTKMLKDGFIYRDDWY